MKKILILGGTGRTGQLLIDESIRQGYLVSVLVRNPAQISGNPKIEIYQGTPYDIKTLENVLIDSKCQYIINALNISRTSDFPWAKLKSPKNLISQTINNLIKLSSKYHFQQIISISAWGVNETKKHIPFWFRWIIENSNIKYGYIEHEKQEELLCNSNLIWTIIRPVGLTNSKEPKRIKISHNNIPKPNILISRTDVAKFIVKIIGEKSFYMEKLTISTF